MAPNKLNLKLKTEWIEKGINEEAIEWANNLGKFLSTKGTDNDQRKESLNSSQIRKFYGELKRISIDFERYKDDIPLLKARLAYAVGRTYQKREKKYASKIEEFYEAILPGLDYKKTSQEKYRNFVKLIEAIVAFHKFYGGE